MIKRIRPQAPLAIVCHVLDVLQEVSVAEGSGRLQRLIVDKVFDTGKGVEDLTIRELLALINDAKREFYQ